MHIEIDLNILIAVVGIGLSVATFFIGRESSAKTSGHKDGALKSDIDYIKVRIDEILLEHKRTDNAIRSIIERLVKVEESTKQSHKRIDKFDNNPRSER